MILAITQRYGLSKENSEIYYINKSFKDIFEKLNILLIPISSLTNLTEFINICDGLIVTGSSIDINPKSYNELPISKVDKKSDELDNFDFTLIKAFHNANKPILGICRGIQSINVCFGGTLYQDIENHKLSKEEKHNVTFDKNSFLFDCYHIEHMQVNSTHHQAVKDVAKDFKIVAKSDDGIIESIENNNIIAVQWHPESMIDIKFFKYFINRVNNSKKHK